VATSQSVHRTVIPESPYCHSRVGLSGIHLDLQQPEIPGQHGFPLRACGNDESGSEGWGGNHRQALIKQKIAHRLMPVSEVLFCLVTTGRRAILTVLKKWL